MLGKYIVPKTLFVDQIFAVSRRFCVAYSYGHLIESLSGHKQKSLNMNLLLMLKYVKKQGL